MILSVPKYDFNWQHEYVFKQPLTMPAGTKLQAKAWYDNSAAQQVEPRPDQGRDVGRSDVGGDDVHEPDVLVPARADDFGATAELRFQGFERFQGSKGVVLLRFQSVQVLVRTWNCSRTTPLVFSGTPWNPWNLFQPFTVTL